LGGTLDDPLLQFLVQLKHFFLGQLAGGNVRSDNGHSHHLITFLDRPQPIFKPADGVPGHSGGGHKNIGVAGFKDGGNGCSGRLMVIRGQYIVNTASHHPGNNGILPGVVDKLHHPLTIHNDNIAAGVFHQRAPAPLAIPQGLLNPFPLGNLQFQPPVKPGQLVYSLLLRFSC
jgi:hypothetical protein